MATITLDLTDQHGEIMRLILAKTSGLTDTDNPNPNGEPNTNTETPPNDNNGDNPNGNDNPNPNDNNGDNPNGNGEPNPPPDFVGDDGKVNKQVTVHAIFYANLGGRTINNNSWINAVKSGDWSRLKYYNPYSKKTHGIDDTYILISKSLEKVVDTMVEKQYQYSQDVMPIYQDYTSANLNRVILNPEHIQERYQQNFTLQAVKVAEKYDKNGNLQYVTNATNELLYYLLNGKYDGEANMRKYLPSTTPIPLISDINKQASIVEFNDDWTNDNPIQDDTNNEYGASARIEFAINPNVFYTAIASVGKDTEQYRDKQGYQLARLVDVPLNSYIVAGYNSINNISAIVLHKKWFGASILSNNFDELMPKAELSPFQKFDINAEDISYDNPIIEPLFANNTVCKQRVSHTFNVGDDYFDLYPFANNHLIEIN